MAAGSRTSPLGSRSPKALAHSGQLTISRFLDANGDGSGGKSFTADYSSAQGIAFIQPAASEVMILERMLVTIEDTTGFAAADYGNITDGLTNGIQVRVQDDSGTVADLTDGVPITTNANWATFCYDADLKTWGNGNEFIMVRWTFGKSGVPVRLSGNKNARLEVLFDDDLRGLVSHNFLVQGRYDNRYF